jgi:hypothetical protein
MNGFKIVPVRTPHALCIIMYGGPGHRLVRHCHASGRTRISPVRSKYNSQVTSNQATRIYAAASVAMFTSEGIERSSL